MARAIGDDDNQCVLWPFRLRDGYGVLVTPRPERRTVTAHRAVLDAAGVRAGLGQTEIRHLCGVRRCVNLRHLRWGTKSENQQDRFRLHGDNNVGERNARAKLTEAKVRTIRASSDTDAALARRFGVSRAAINLARNRVTWAHVA